MYTSLFLNAWKNRCSDGNCEPVTEPVVHSWNASQMAFLKPAFFILIFFSFFFYNVIIVCVCVHKTTSKKGFLNLAGGCTAGAWKVKIQHVSRRNEGLILTPHEPFQPGFLGNLGWSKPKTGSSAGVLGASGVGFRPPMGTSHGSKDKQIFAGYLQHLRPWGCVFISFLGNVSKRSFSFLVGKGEGEKNDFIYCVWAWSSPVIASSWPCGSGLMAPVLPHSCHAPASDGLKEPRDKFDGVMLLFPSVWRASALFFYLKHKCSKTGYK